MQRTKIVVGYQHTHNLGNYSNARPSITIEATLDEGEDVEAAKAQLAAEARAYVHEQIDQALEHDGQPAKFSTEPRFRLERTVDATFGGWNEPRRTAAVPERLLVILPVGMSLKLRDTGGDTKTWWTSQGGDWHKMRLASIRRVAAEWLEAEPAYRLIDCSDGDLSKLPAWALELPVDPGPPAPALAVVEEMAAGRTFTADDELDQLDEIAYDPDDDEEAA